MNCRHAPLKTSVAQNSDSFSMSLCFCNRKLYRKASAQFHRYKMIIDFNIYNDIDAMRCDAMVLISISTSIQLPIHIVFISLILWTSCEKGLNILFETIRRRKKTTLAELCVWVSVFYENPWHFHVTPFWCIYTTYHPAIHVCILQQNS